MIAIDKSFDGRMATVSGDKAELMLFLCIWQSSLWPNWMKETFRSNGTMEMHKTAVRLIRDDGTLLLNDDGRAYEDSTAEAIEACRALGVEVRA